MGMFETLLGLPEKSSQPVADTANRSLTLAGTEILRNPGREFRGNGLPGEPHSRLAGNEAVTHMKNACAPYSRDVKICTPRWVLAAAAAAAW
ncbi:hypothetical protein [Streptomyces sp. NPDC059861]|uniref:hypothetical protein n=1 Tax=Streptomyces sp. NPDC059861 TaxID=3346974 RepID=UPI00364B16C2